MTQDLVSIITPSFNCGGFIAQTIDSVIAQSYPNWEMIIVDDCSTDNTADVVAQYADPRIKFVRLEENSGAAVARNKGLALAQGRWIAFLDSDDLWLPDKLEKQLNFMKDSGIAFSYHAYDEIDEFGNPLGVSVSGKKVLSRFDMFSCCWPGCLTVMYDAQRIGLIQIKNVKKDNDSAIWLKAIRKSKCYLLKENLACYRRRRNSITPTGVVAKIKWHYTLFRQAEGLNPIGAAFWMIMNIFGNTYKKLFYVHRH